MTHLKLPNMFLTSFDLLWCVSNIAHIMMLCSFWNFLRIPDFFTIFTTSLRDDCEERGDNTEPPAWAQPLGRGPPPPPDPGLPLQSSLWGRPGLSLSAPLPLLSHPQASAHSCPHLSSPPGLLSSLINRNWLEARQEIQARLYWGHRCSQREQK